MRSPLRCLIPEQHCRIGHVPLFAVTGIAKSGVWQQPVQGCRNISLFFYGKAYRYLIAIHQLEIHRTTATELKPKRQALSNHSVDPDDLPGPVFQQIEQPVAARFFYLQKVENKPDAQ